MLVEPPRPVVPPRAGLTISSVDRLRTAAAAAALVLAVTSRGDALGLAVLLAVVAWRPLAAAAAGAALVAVSWRWGSTSLEAIAGAQAVLGPAGVVGPTRAAVGAWLAAGAIVLCASSWATDVVGGRGARSARGGAPNLGRRTLALLPVAAGGAAAAVVVAGPAPGGDVWVRVLATLLAMAVALGVVWCRAHGDRVALVLDGLALASGAAALVLVGTDAPAWSGTVDSHAAAHGAATALAVGVLVVAGGTAVAMGRRQA